VTTPPPDPEIARRLRAILDSSEFHKRFSDYITEELTKGFKAAFHWLKELTPWMRGWLTAVCILLLAAIALQTWLLLRSSKRTLRVPGRRSPMDIDVGDDPEAIAGRARELAAAGHLREAARALQQAALLRLARQRGLPWRAELADWEWVALLRDAPGLGDFTQAAQRVAYGPQVDPQGFASCERLYAAVVGGGHA
jgi:hypothetical protein